MAINWVPSSPSTHSAQTHIHPAIQERERERERERYGSCSSAPHEWRNWRNKLCQQLPGSGKLN